MKLELLELNGGHTWKSNLNFNISAITQIWLLISSEI